MYLGIPYTWSTIENINVQKVPTIKTKRKYHSYIEKTIQFYLFFIII